MAMACAPIGPYRGCRALLISSQSISNAATKSTGKPQTKAESKSNASGSGIRKPLPLSIALQNFLGVPVASRTEAVKQIWLHIKQNNLQDPRNKKEIVCDEKLKSIFDGKVKVQFLEIAKLLSCHFIKAT